MLSLQECPSNLLYSLSQEHDSSKQQPNSGIEPELQHYKVTKTRVREAAVVSQLITSLSFSEGQLERSSRPHNRAAPKGPAQKSSVKLILESQGTNVFTSSGRQPSGRAYRMKQIKEALRLSCVCSDPLVMTLPAFPAAPRRFSYPNLPAKRKVVCRYNSECSCSWIFSRHTYLPRAVIPPTVGWM